MQMNFWSFFPALKAISPFCICDHALNWLRSYLSDRTQFVRIQGVSSHVNDLPYGVPQGSVLPSDWKDFFAYIHENKPKLFRHPTSDFIAKMFVSV